MEKHRFFVGAYAAAGRPSIFRYAADLSAGTLVCETCCAQAERPCCLWPSRDGRLLYAVEELHPDGRVTVFLLSGDHILRCSSLDSGGASPCALAIDDNGRFLVAAHYTSGSLTLFALDENGLPHRQLDLCSYSGHGVHPTRQQSPHLAFAALRGQDVYAADLGLDALHYFHIDPDAQRLVPGTDLPLPPGTGPRRFCFSPFHPELIYVLGELDSCVHVLRLSSGETGPVQRISTLPQNAQDSGRASALCLSPDGRFLFAANRRLDSLTAFEILADGTLRLRHIAPCGGSGPRDILCLENCLVVANEDSANLALVPFSPDTQQFCEPCASVGITAPVCLCPEANIR